MQLSQPNTGVLLIEPLGTNCCEIAIKIHMLLFKKMQLKSLEMAAVLSRPQCVNYSYCLFL